MQLQQHQGGQRMRCLCRSFEVSDKVSAVGEEDRTPSVTHSFLCIFIITVILLDLQNQNLPQHQPNCGLGHDEENYDDNEWWRGTSASSKPLNKLTMDGDDLPELGHDGGLGAAPLVHQLHRRVLVREREAAFHLGF